MKKLVTLVLFSVLASFTKVKATHINSAEINAEHISGNLYQVTLRILSDCPAIAPPTSVPISFSNASTGFTRTLTQTHSADSIGMNYSCGCWVSSSTCNSGTFPGNHYVIYSDTVTLPTSSSWTATYSVCCRYGVTNIANAQSIGIYVQTEINQSAFPNNSTPFFPITGRLAISHNDTFQMDMSAMDYDNDSIVYALVSVQSGAGVFATYNPGYSGSSPISGFTIDPITGILTSTGTATIGDYYVGLKATEYDRVSGNIKSVLTKDFGVSIINIANGTKYLGDAPTSNGFANGTNVTSICGNSAGTTTLSFSSTQGDVSLWSDISWKYPGVTYSNVEGPTTTMTINIPATVTQSKLEFYVQAAADSGIFTNLSFEKFEINRGGFSTSGDQTICLGDTAVMSTNSLDPNPIYNWTLISGTPIDTNSNSPGYSFSCNSCGNPSIIPTQTSTYVANSVPNSCGQPDTFTITVIQPITLQTPNAQILCQGDSFLIDVDGGTNTYLWMENGTTMNFNGDSMWVSPMVSTNYSIHNMNQMCGDSQLVTLSVVQPLSTISDTQICLGDSVQLTTQNADTISWTPSSSLSCANCDSPWASPTQTTTYSAINTSMGCPSMDSVTIQVETIGVISGVAELPGGSAMSFVDVLLIEYNANDSTVSILDSTQADNDGQFYFSTDKDSLFIKVIPDSASFPNSIPTYYGETSQFLNASHINVFACDTTSIVITSINSPNPGGSGFLAGNVYQGAGKTDGAGDPVVGLELILINDQNQEYAYAQTDANGYYSFAHLENGTYKVYIDVMQADNLNAPSLTVDEHSIHFNYNFKLENGALIPTTITSIQKSSALQVNVFPNPSENSIFINGLEGNFTYEIIGIEGKKYVDAFTQSNSPIDISTLSNGTYFIRVKNDNHNSIHRFIKK